MRFMDGDYYAFGMQLPDDCDWYEEERFMSTAPKTWAEMSRDERTVYLAPLVGKRIRVVVKRELEACRKIYGQAIPLPWKNTRLFSIEPHGEKPALVMAPFWNPSNPFGMLDMRRNVLLFEQIAAIEAISVLTAQAAEE